MALCLLAASARAEELTLALPFAPVAPTQTDAGATTAEAVAAFKAGRMREAQTLALKANAVSPDADAAELVAVTSLRLGEMPRAHQVYRRLAAARGVPEGPRGRALRQLEALGGQGGTLSLVVTPPEARVTFDDVDLGPAADLSLVFSLPGKHRLRFSADGYSETTRAFTFARGRNESANITLTAAIAAPTQSAATIAAAPVPVRFECVPMELTLVIDGLELPCPRDPVSLDVGEHSLAASAPGYDPTATQLPVAPGMSLPVPVFLTPRPALLKLTVAGDGAERVQIALGDAAPVPVSADPVAFVAGSLTLRVQRPECPDELRVTNAAPGETVLVALDAACPRGTVAAAPVVAPTRARSLTATAAPAPAQGGVLKAALRWGGVATIAVGGIVGAVALAQASELQDACPDGHCPSNRGDDIASLKAKSWASTIGVALGAAALGASFAF